MKVFVTGATGFVGGHLIDALHAKKIEHLGLARSLKKWEGFNLPGKPLTGNLEDLQRAALESWINELLMILPTLFILQGPSILLMMRHLRELIWRRRKIFSTH